MVAASQQNKTLIVSKDLSITCPSMYIEASQKVVNSGHINMYKHFGPHVYRGFGPHYLFGNWIYIL